MNKNNILRKGIYFDLENEASYYPDWIGKYWGGWMIYQHPLQLEAFLNWAKDKKIQSYLEIGTWYGGTFRFIHSFLKCKGIGIDVKQPFGDWAWYIKKNGVRFICDSSLNVEPIKTDLVFIDGGHYNKFLKNDWEKFGRRAKYCAFHDIINPRCPQVMEFWSKLEGEKVEFTQTYEGYEKNWGIGCLML